MAKKKDGNGVGPGHNSQLTEEEKRALTFHHKRAYEQADALVEKAKADRTAVADLAKADLGKGALADIKDMILANTDKKMKAMVERTMRLARLAGLKIGTQTNLFEPVVDYIDQGRVAGMEGQECRAPNSLSAEAQQQWIAGWHEGQTVLASAFKKKRPVDPPAANAPDPAQIDLSERTDLQTAGNA